LRPYPYINQKELAKLWGYGTNVTVERMISAKKAANYVGKYMRKQLIDDRLYAKKRYWASRGLIRPVEQYGTNVEKLLEFLNTIPFDQKEEYSNKSYLSEYHGCEIKHSRIFISKELVQKFYKSIKGLQTS